MDGRDPINEVDTITPRKFDGLWYNDADLVIYAGKAKFRVYRGTLSTHSAVLKEMFSNLPQKKLEEVQDPSKAENESCTVITLTDDENDVCRFFLAIFDPSFYNPPPFKYTLNVTNSILRLAQKYEVQYLISRAISHLDNFFPMERESIQEIAKDEIRDHNSSASSESDIILNDYLEALSLIFSMTDIALWMVPGILYLIASRWRASGAMKHPNFASLQHPLQLSIIRVAVLKVLEDKDVNAWVAMLPSEKCTSTEECAYVSRVVQRNDFRLPAATVAPFRTDRKLLSSGKHLCGNCQAQGKRYQEVLAEKYWSEYPKICCDKSWDELRGSRSKYLEIL